MRWKKNRWVAGNFMKYRGFAISYKQNKKKVNINGKFKHGKRHVFLYQPQLAGLIVLVSVYVVRLTFNFKCKYFYKNVFFCNKKNGELYWTYLWRLIRRCFYYIFFLFIYFILPSTRFGKIMWFFKYYIFPP